MCDIEQDMSGVCFFFFNDTATTEIYTLSLHDALPICHGGKPAFRPPANAQLVDWRNIGADKTRPRPLLRGLRRSEEHTSELQSLAYLVCRLLLEKKKVDTLVEERFQRVNRAALFVMTY